MERKNKKTKSVGNGEGSLYFSESQQCWIFQYVVNGYRKTMKQKKNEKVNKSYGPRSFNGYGCCFFCRMWRTESSKQHI